MFDSNNNKVDVDEHDANNNAALSWYQSIGGIQKVFSGLEHERSKYKKKLECLQQQRNDENFVLLKSMDRLRMVCCEGKRATDRANGERNKYRKLVVQLKKPNGVSFGTVAVVSPKSETGAVPKRNSAVSSSPTKVLTSDKQIDVAPTSEADVSANGSPSSVKRKFCDEQISPLLWNKKQKTGAGKENKPSEEKSRAAGEQKK